MTRLGLVAGFLLSLCAGTVSAQLDASLLTTGGAASKLKLADRFQRQALQVFPEEQALEEPVDPETYVLGPGDLLGVSLRGGVDEFFEVRVSPEGNLLMPMVPMVKVEGMTLADAAQMVQKKWTEDSQALIIELSLLEIRTFRAMVAGAVEDPGTFVVTPADRASMLVFLAQGVLDESHWREYYSAELSKPDWDTPFDYFLEEEEVPLASERYAWLERSDGRRVRVDLLRIKRTGNSAYDPYLEAGDRLIVGYWNELTPTVQIAGAVGYPDTYEWVEGDQVRDLVEIAGGFLPEARRQQVRVTRFSDEGQPEIHEVDLTGDKAGMLLQPGDLIQVKTPGREKRRLAVTVTGEVQFPGSYEIHFGETNIRDIIELAGGYTDYAFSDAVSVLRRRERSSAIELEFRHAEKVMAQVQSHWERAVTEFDDRWPDRFMRMTVGCDPADEDAVNLMEEFVLEDGDIIQVPSFQHSVLFVGQVRQPGWYPFVEGWEYNDYLDAAGGYADKAWKSGRRLVHFNSNVWEKPSGGDKIYPGDKIFIPETPFRYGWNTFKDVLLVLSQAATVIVVIISIN